MSVIGGFYATLEVDEIECRYSPSHVVERATMEGFLLLQQKLSCVLICGGRGFTLCVSAHLRHT